MNPPAGPFSAIAEQVRQKREQSRRAEREKQQESPRCFYCHTPIPLLDREWIAHGTVAHSACAWAADGAFWAMLGAEA
jgi:hypothetical protein